VAKVLINESIEAIKVQKNTSEHQQQKKGRLVLLALFLFFAAPLVLVMYMYQTNWHPEGESRGELIKPVLAIKVPTGFENIKTAYATDIPGTLWHEKWSIVLIADQCDPVCEARLYDVRQIHASLEKNMNRVQRILITHQQSLEALRIKYPDLIILSEPKQDIDALVSQFKRDDPNVFDAHAVYLVDPLGNWMMKYGAEIEAKDIRKDVEHLLRYSWAG
jgi:cytochrome oxidase Cu insertion factor (SCO1/SenC/PrrC family)